jgi:exonuclease SbcD
MKLLHTSDWHVGKAMRGHSRADEHRAVLAEIAAIAADESVDLIAVAGDLYETAAPSAESEAIVTRALLDLADVAPVVAVSGNHDNARRLEAITPLMALGRITMATRPRSPADGGRAVIAAESGQEADIALLPFVSQRAIVRSVELMSQAGFENAQTYADRLQRVMAALCADFGPDRVNIIVAHAFVHGGAAGGGERAAHLADEYGVSAVDFPVTAAYVALGHLHRPQQMLGATAIHYCGSPLALDFGESEQHKQVNVVELAPGLPAKVRAVPLTKGRPLITVTGAVADLRSRVDGGWDPGDAWIRVRITEPSRTGLADEVRELLGPGVVDIRVEAVDLGDRRSAKPRAGRSPRELFADYLEESNVADPKLEARFAQLLDDVG